MSTDEFPTARRASVMFVYDHRLMLWGGMTQVIMGEGDGRIIVDIDIPGTYIYSLFKVTSERSGLHGEPISNFFGPLPDYGKDQ